MSKSTSTDYCEHCHRWVVGGDHDGDCPNNPSNPSRPKACPKCGDDVPAVYWPQHLRKCDGEVDDGD